MFTVFVAVNFICAVLLTVVLVFRVKLKSYFGEIHVY